MWKGSLLLFADAGGLIYLELMKKTHLGDKSKLISSAHKKHRHELTRRNKIYNQSRIGYAPVRLHPNSKKKQYHKIVVPETLDLERNYAYSIKVINSVKNNGEKSKNPLLIDFSKCREIAPAAMLLLLAHIDRIRRLRGKNALTGIYPLDDKLDKRMCAMGFYALLNIKAQHSPERTYPMEYIKFATDTKKTDNFANKFKTDLFGDSKVKVATNLRFYSAISEALLNCLNHAYPGNYFQEQDIKNRWWITGHYHRPTDRLHVMFCDLGVGIPATLPTKHTKELILRVLSQLSLGLLANDGNLIRAAMELGRSKTGENFRGKGLNDLRKFIEKTGVGKLTIYSNKGRYNYSLIEKQDLSVEMKEEHHTNNESIYGTLIHWSVPRNRVMEANTEQINAN